jgi:ribose transport system ATP-binding protein
VDVLEVVGLSKSYGDAIALDKASLTLHAGEIHAIVGENGAGKSTLVKCLSGIVVPDSGTVGVKGQALKFGVPTASRVLGVSTSFQELSLLGNLTVAENLLISALPTTAGIVTKRGVQAKAREILAEWGVEDLAPDALVGKLPLSAKQRLEIVRAMYVRPSILILDEPTAALPDTNWLFTNVRRLVAEGTTVVYISHKLREIQELCHRGTIMRNGAIVGTFDDPNFDHNELISTMIGRSINLAFPPRISPLATDAPVVLKARSISVGSRIRNVDLDIRNGEIVGHFKRLFGDEPRVILRPCPVSSS